MAGERYAKLTIRASWRPSGIFNGYLYQTKEVCFRLAGVWEFFGNDKWSPVSGTPYAVPAPDADPAYTTTGMTNLAAALRQVITRRGLPYQVSEPRAAGLDPATGLAQVELDVTALEYFGLYDLDFQNVATADGWVVVSNLTTIVPLTAEVIVQNATIFGSATGTVYMTVHNANGGPFTYTWADDPTATGYLRQNVKVGTYRCTITDGKGASGVFTAVVGSDPRLEVQVRSTDTSITLVASGGLAPYTYAWADGPTGPERLNLGAGTYKATVTDARGATREVEVTLSAYSYFWSQNPILLPLDAGDDYRADPSTKPNLSFLCEVWVERDYLSGVFEQVGITLEQPADAQGRTTFQVQALLQPFLDYHVPAVGSRDLEQATPLFRRFFLQHAEQYGLEPVAEPAVTLSRSYVVLGGLNFYEAQARTWFTDFQPTVQPFLSWEPSIKHVLTDQPEYLYYMVRTDPGTVATQLRVHFSDGVEQQIELEQATGVRDFEVYCLPAGYAELGLAQLTGPDHAVSWWELTVTTPGGAQVLSETRRFVLDRQVFPRRQFFLFATSLGGMATYAALGESQLELELKGEEAARSLVPGYDPQLGDVAVGERTLRPTVKVAAGKRTTAQLLASQDLLLSRRVLLRRNGRWVPGFLKAKTVTLLDENKLVQVQEFEFTMPTERLYTPSL